MSFCLVIFHVLTFLISLARNEMASAWHDGMWLAKVLLIIGGYLASFFISADFFTGFFMPAAAWVSGIFLIFQALLMLEVAYKVNGTVVGNWNRDQSTCNSAIMTFVGFGALLMNLFLVVLSFVYFKCFRNVVFQIISILGVLVMYLMVALKNRINVRKDTSIITSGIASLYCMYLQWSALSADIDGTCNHVKGKATNDTLQIISGICFTVFCLFIISATKSRAEMSKEEQKKADDAALSTTDPLGAKLDDEGKPLTDNRTEQ